MTTANRPDEKSTRGRHTISSTYRMQFHKNFTFQDAIRITPYLHALGITDAYASPYLKAVPGSTHGYDVIDHSRLNDEVGTDADRAAWVAALAERGMSHVRRVGGHVGVRLELRLELRIRRLADLIDQRGSIERRDLQRVALDALRDDPVDHRRRGLDRSL